MVCQATILPAIERLTASPVPETEQVLPLDVVRSTRRKYIERVVIQANGCYERHWYDAGSGMIRRRSRRPSSNSMKRRAEKRKSRTVPVSFSC